MYLSTVEKKKANYPYRPLLKKITTLFYLVEIVPPYVIPIKVKLQEQWVTGLDWDVNFLHKIPLGLSPGLAGWKNHYQFKLTGTSRWNHLQKTNPFAHLKTQEHTKIWVTCSYPRNAVLPIHWKQNWSMWIFRSDSINVSWWIKDQRRKL